MGLNDLASTENLIRISEAANYLGVSIDTIRRWDRSGVLHSLRPDGKNRYFYLTELERIKFSQQLTISQVAQKLGVSMATLRRLEKKGLVESTRDKNGERIYTQDNIDKFLQSDYFLRKKLTEGKTSEQGKTYVKSDDLSSPLTEERRTVVLRHRRNTKMYVLLSIIIICLAFAVIIPLVVFPQTAFYILNNFFAALSVSEIARETWGYASRITPAFNSPSPVVQGLAFILTVAVVGVVFYLETWSSKSQKTRFS